MTLIQNLHFRFQIFHGFLKIICDSAARKGYTQGKGKVFETPWSSPSYVRNGFVAQIQKVVSACDNKYNNLTWTQNEKNFSIELCTLLVRTVASV